MKSANQTSKRNPVHLSTLFYIAWKNLSSRKLRSFLTISGIVVGIGSISFLISFGLGLQQLVTKNVIGDKSIKSIEVTTPNSRIIKLDTKSVNKFRSFPHVSNLGLQYSFPASVGLKGGGTDSVIYGIDLPYQAMTSLNLLEGRLMQKQDADVALVSLSALKSIGLGNAKKALNQKLNVIVPLSSGSDAKEMKKQLTIVGVVDSGGNSEVFAPSALFDVENVPTYNQVKIITDDTSNISTLRKQVESSGFQTSSPIDTLTEINKLFKFFNFILAGFGGIGIFVAILGMFNTLTISLLERTKEIGLMITLGGRKKDMRRLFMIESILLSLIGVAVGLILSYSGSKLVGLAVNRNAASRVSEHIEIFSTPAWLLVLLTLFMVLVGLLVAFFPARRAQKVNPIDALRRD